MTGVTSAGAVRLPSVRHSGSTRALNVRIRRLTIAAGLTTFMDSLGSHLTLYEQRGRSRRSADVSLSKPRKNEQQKKQQNRGAQEHEGKFAPSLVNRSAHQREEGAANQSGPGSERAVGEPAQRFPPGGHACPHNNRCADEKYEKRADRKPKKPRHKQVLICVIYRDATESPLTAASFALLSTIISQPSTFLVQRPAGWFHRLVRA